MENAPISEDGALNIPSLEVRVPPEWQSKMSTRALSSVSPIDPPELVNSCCQIIEAKIKADAGGEAPATLAAFAWQWLEAQHGSFKLAEGAAASMVSGVESSWQLQPCVQLFGELCGMLTDEYSESVARRVLGLLRDADVEGGGDTPRGDGSGGAALVPLTAVASTLLGEGDAGTVAISQAVAELPRLQLPTEQQHALEAELQALASGDAAVRLDALLVAAVTACRAEVRQQLGGEAANPPEEMSAEQQQAAEQAAAEAATAAAPPPPAEVVSSDLEPEAEAEAEAEEAEEAEEEEQEAEEAEEAEAEEAEAEEEEGAAAGGAASSSSDSAPDWEALAAKLPTSQPEMGACHALFALFDSTEQGSITREEVETGVLQTLGLAASAAGDPRPRAGETDAVRRAVGRGFDAAKRRSVQNGAEGGAHPAALFLDEFRPLLVYVRRHLDMLAALPEAALPDAMFSAAELPRLAPRLARWGLGDAAATFASLDDGSGLVAFSVFSDATLRQLLDGQLLEGASAAEVVEGMVEEGGGTPEGEAEGEADGEEEGEEEGGGSHQEPCIGHGLEPVPETTERSTFSATQLEHSAEPGGFGSVQAGFFDASKLDNLDATSSDLGATSAGLEAPPAAERVERPPPADFEAALAEIELLKSELGAASGAQEAMRALHARRVAGLLERNDALQAQLRELNAQVERVLQREIKRHRPGAAASPAAAKAAPGSKGKPAKPRAPKRAQTMGGPPAAFFEAQAVAVAQGQAPEPGPQSK